MLERSLHRELLIEGQRIRRAVDQIPEARRLRFLAQLTGVNLFGVPPYFMAAWIREDLDERNARDATD